MDYDQDEFGYKHKTTTQENEQSFVIMNEKYPSNKLLRQASKISGSQSPIKKWLNEEKLQFSGIKVEITKNNLKLVNL